MRPIGVPRRRLEEDVFIASKYINPIASLDVWVQPKEPWRLPNPIPGIHSINLVSIVFSYVGWHTELPGLLQELSHSSRSYIIFVQNVGLSKFLTERIHGKYY